MIKSRRSWIIFLIPGLFTTCGGEDEAPSATVDPVIRAAVSLDIRDVANAGDATDLEISFVKPTDREFIQEFRILIVKNEDAGAFDSLASLSVSEGNYIVNSVNAGSSKLSFDASVKDIDGDVIQEGVAYNFFVLSKGTEESGLGGRLSNASDIIQLARKSAVRTLTNFIQSGSGGMDADEAGNIYMGDFGVTLSGGGTRVFLITPEGEVSTFATGLNGASGNDFDNEGNLYQSNISNNTISKITPEGVVTQFASGVNNPVGIVFDGDSGFYVCNCGNNTISRIDMDGNVSVFSSGSLFACPNGIDIDAQGNLYVVNFNSAILVKITPDGTPGSFATLPGNNNGHLLIHEDIMYVAGRNRNSIYTVDFQGEVKLFAGTGVRGLDNGSLEQASFSLPNDFALSPDGTKLYVNDKDPNATGNTISPVVVRVIDIVN